VQPLLLWISNITQPVFVIVGTAVAQWLRCCATNRKVADSIPAGISGFFIDITSFRSHSASNRNITGIFPGGKGGRCVRLITYHHPVPLSRHLGVLTSWNRLGLSRPVMGLLSFYVCNCSLIYLACERHIFICGFLHTTVLFNMFS